MAILTQYCWNPLASTLSKCFSFCKRTGDQPYAPLDDQNDPLIPAPTPTRTQFQVVQGKYASPVSSRPITVLLGLFLSVLAAIAYTALSLEKQDEVAEENRVPQEYADFLALDTGGVNFFFHLRFLLPALQGINFTFIYAFKTIAHSLTQQSGPGGAFKSFLWLLSTLAYSMAFETFLAVYLPAFSALPNAATIHNSDNGIGELKGLRLGLILMGIETMLLVAEIKKMMRFGYYKLLDGINKCVPLPNHQAKKEINILLGRLVNAMKDNLLSDTMTKLKLKDELPKTVNPDNFIKTLQVFNSTFGPAKPDNLGEELRVALVTALFLDQKLRDEGKTSKLATSERFISRLTKHSKADVFWFFHNLYNAYCSVAFMFPLLMPLLFSALFTLPRLFESNPIMNSVAEYTGISAVLSLFDSPDMPGLVSTLCVLPFLPIVALIFNTTANPWDENTLRKTMTKIWKCFLDIKELYSSRAQKIFGISVLLMSVLFMLSIQGAVRAADYGITLASEVFNNMLPSQMAEYLTEHDILWPPEENVGLTPDQQTILNSVIRKMDVMKNLPIKLLGLTIPTAYGEAFIKTYIAGNTRPWTLVTIGYNVIWANYSSGMGVIFDLWEYLRKGGFGLKSFANKCYHPIVQATYHFIDAIGQLKYRTSFPLLALTSEEIDLVRSPAFQAVINKEASDTQYLALMLALLGETLDKITDPLVLEQLFNLIPTSVDQNIRDEDAKKGSLGAWKGKYMACELYGDAGKEAQPLDSEKEAPAISSHEGKPDDAPIPLATRPAVDPNKYPRQTTFNTAELIRGHVELHITDNDAEKSNGHEVDDLEEDPAP